MPAKSVPSPVLIPRFSPEGVFVGMFPMPATIGAGVDSRRGNAAAAESIAKSPTLPGAGEEEEEADPFASPFDLFGGDRGPGSPDGTAFSGDADHEDGLTGTAVGKGLSGGARLGSRGVTGALGQRKQVNGREDTRGAFGGWGKGGWHGGLATQSTKEVDAEGNMTEGSKTGLAASKEGVVLSHDEAHAGETSGFEMGLTGDGISGKVKTGTPKVGDDPTTGSSAAVGVNLGRDAIGAEAAYTSGRGGVSGGVTVHHGTEGARDDSAVLQEHLGGDSLGVTRQSGLSAKFGVEAKGKTFGAGLGVHAEDTSKVGFHKREADAVQGLPESPWASPEQQFGQANEGRLDGVDAVADVNLDKLGAGEAYSFTHQTGKGVEGSASAYGISGSLGYSDRSQEQTVLSRTDEETLRVSMSAAEGDEWKGGVGAFDALEVGMSETSGNSASVGFTAKGEAGKRAVIDFQKTGLLPGVENIAADLAPEAWEAFQEIRTEYRKFEGTDSPMAEMYALQLRSQLYAAAAPLNRAFLESKDHDLADTDVEGVEYDDHTTSKTEGENASVSLLGWDVMDAGYRETEWDKQYREGKSEHTERGYEREEDYWFAEDEKSRVTLDPKGFASSEGETPELVMFSEWVTGRGSRDAMAALGPEAFDLPPEAIEAWQKGEMGEGEMDRLAVVLTQNQLDRLAEIAETDGDDVQKLAGNVSPDGNFLDQGLLAPLFEEAAVEGAAFHGKFAMQGGDAMMKEMMERVQKVASVDDFLGLSPKERRAIVISSAVRAARSPNNPWEGMRLALRIPDEKERNALIRELFMTIERSKDGANAPIQFLHWVQGEAKEAGVDPKEILGATKVVHVDQGLEDKEKSYETVEKGGRMAADVHAQDLASALDPKAMTLRGWQDDHGPQIDDSSDLFKSGAQRRADKPADMLLAMRRKGGPQMVELLIEEGLKDDPKFLEKIRDRVSGDKPRAAIVEYALRGTKYGAEAAGR